MTSTLNRSSITTVVKRMLDENDFSAVDIVLPLICVFLDRATEYGVLYISLNHILLRCTTDDELGHHHDAGGMPKDNVKDKDLFAVATFTSIVSVHNKV